MDFPFQTESRRRDALSPTGCAWHGSGAASGIGQLLRESRQKEWDNMVS